MKPLWLRNWLKASSSTQRALPVRSRAQLGCEPLEDRITPAYDVGINNDPSLFLSIDDSTPGLRTITAFQSGANINIASDIVAALSAGRDIVINNGNTGTENGNIRLDSPNPGDINIPTGMGQRKLTIIADPTSKKGDIVFQRSILGGAGTDGLALDLTSRGATNLGNITNNAAITVTALSSTGATSSFGGTINTNGHDISLTADNIQIAGTTNAGAGNITLQPNASNRGVGLNNNAGGVVDLTTAELQNLSAANVFLGRTNSTGTSGVGAAGAVDLSATNYNLILRGTSSAVNFNLTGSNTLTLASGKTLTFANGGNVNSNGNATTDVTIGGAGTVKFSSAATVGSAASPLNASVSQLDTSTTTGDLNLADQTDLSVIGSLVSSNRSINLASTGNISFTSGSADVTANDVTLHSGTDGTGNLTFGAVGVQLNANAQTFQAGDGTGGITTAVADLRTNSPDFRDSSGTGRPLAFTYRQDASIADADIPTIAQLGGGNPPLLYTIESDDGSVTVATAGKVVNSNLTLTGNTAVNINGSLAPSSLVTNGPTNFNNVATVMSTGDQTYNGAVTISTSSPNLTAATVTFGSTVAGGGNSLTVTGDAVFNGAVSGVLNLLVGNTTDINTASITTTGTQGYNSTVTLEVDATLTGTVLGFYAIDGTGHSFTISGDAQINSAVSGVTNLSVSGTTFFSGGSITTTGTQGYTGDVTLYGDTTLSGTTPTFGGAVTSSNSSDLTLSFSGTTTIDGAKFLSIQNLTSNSGGTTNLTGTLTTSGFQTYSDAVALTGAVVLGSTTNQAIAFGSTVQSSGGARALTVNTTGNTTFSGAVGGGGNPLASLTTNAGGTTQINGGSVNTTGSTQTYNDNVTLGTTAATLTGTAVFFNDDLMLGSTSANAKSTLQVAGSLKLAGVTTLTSTFAGTGSSQFGHVIVSGNTTYNGATLALNYNGFTPAPGNSFDVVKNAIVGVGQFANAPTPAANLGGVLYSVTYTGGTGKDFILSVRPGLKFDMKADTKSALPAGWNRTLATTKFADATGYGWVSTAGINGSLGPVPTTLPPGTTASMFSDYNFGTTPATFRVFVGAGQSASVNVYSYGYVLGFLPTGLQVSVNGAAPVKLLTGQTVVSVNGTGDGNGYLDLTFSAPAGAGIWAVNGLEVTLGA